MVAGHSCFWCFCLSLAQLPINCVQNIVMIFWQFSIRLANLSWVTIICCLKKLAKITDDNLLISLILCSYLSSITQPSGIYMLGRNLIHYSYFYLFGCYESDFSLGFFYQFHLLLLHTFNWIWQFQLIIRAVLKE